MPTKLVYNIAIGEWQEKELTSDEVTALQNNPLPETANVNFSKTFTSFLFSTYFVNTQNNNVNITLPNASGYLGVEVTFVKTSALNNMNLIGSLQGSSSLTVTDMGSITITSDNTRWWIK